MSAMLKERKDDFLALSVCYLDVLFSIADLTGMEYTKEMAQ